MLYLSHFSCGSVSYFLNMLICPTVSIININVLTAAENTGSILLDDDLCTGKHRKILVDGCCTGLCDNGNVSVQG